MISHIVLTVTIITTFISAVVGFLILTRMKSDKREYFALFVFCAVVGELGYILEMTATTTEGALAGTKIMYAGIGLVAPVFLMFVQKYCEIQLKKIVNILIAAVILFIILLVWTSNSQNLFYTSFYISDTTQITYLVVNRGILYPLAFIHPLTCITISVVILVKKMKHAAREKRINYLLMIVTSLMPIVASFINFVFGINYGPIMVGISIVVLYVGVFKHDLLDNEETVRTQNWLREMVGNISHEMKTPLTIIAADIQIAEQFIDDGNIAGAKELLREAWQETMQTANLVTDALTFSRGRNELKPMENFSSGTIIEATLAIFEPVLKKHGNTLIRAITKPAPMYGNPDMLSVALVNLLLNANRHTSGGIIKVAWMIVGNTLSLTVEDNGSGIPAEMLPHVFESGVSGENSTGLGLSIVKRVTELHGGTVTIESEKEKGTSVTLTFPIVTIHSYAVNSNNLHTKC